MPRIPYVYPEKGQSEVADKIRERRKNGELIPLDGMFLNAPAIAAGYNSLLSAVRAQNSLSDGLRELLILRVAALNGAAYEWKAHEPIGRQGGLTTSQLLEIRDTSRIGKAEHKTDLTPVQAAALDYTDAMTREVKVPDEVFNNIKSFLNDQQMVEATATVAAYNMVSRFLVALDVADMANAGVPVPE